MHGRGNPKTGPGRCGVCRAERFEAWKKLCVVGLLAFLVRFQTFSERKTTFETETPGEPPRRSAKEDKSEGQRRGAVLRRTTCLHPARLVGSPAAPTGAALPMVSAAVLVMGSGESFGGDNAWWWEMGSGWSWGGLGWEGLMGTGVAWGLQRVGECSGAFQRDQHLSPKQHPPNQHPPKISIPQFSIHPPN